VVQTRREFFGTTAAIFLGSITQALADEWPDRPVKIISPFSPGGTSDVLARILADVFSKDIKPSFYVDTRAGAGGMIGASAVEKADPDGYTLLLSGNAANILAPAFSPAPLFDGVTDFTHIAYLGGSPVVLVVHPSLPVKTYREFLDYVKGNSTPVNYTSSGVGTHGFVFGEQLARIEGLKLNHIPYKGGGAAMVDLIGGQVTIATITFTSVAAQVRSGALRALAVSAEQRLKTFPDVPTFSELGHPDLVSASWFALSGPKGLPSEIVDRLNHEVSVALNLEGVKRQLADQTVEVKIMSSAETTKFFEDEAAQWRPLAVALREKGGAQ
jgi:tripartite-type tricarboxylate transporter receptor subunit TctC